LFSSSLNRSLTGRTLEPGILQYIRANEIKLAGLDLPSDIDVDTRALIRMSLSRAFVFGFRTVMVICAGLSLASAAIALVLIPAKAGERAK
jgi:hypothetical protein